MAANEKNLAHSIGLHQVNTEVAIDEVSYDMLFTMHKSSPRDPVEQLRDFERFLSSNLSAKEKEKELKNWAEYTDVAMNKKIEQVFEQWTNGSKWMDTGDKVKSMLLLGPPGQGKTTTFKEAGRKVSAALGLNFKLNPGDNEAITPRDYMFVSMEFSGENQITTLGGIPAKTTDDATGIEYMTKLVNYRLAMACTAGGATVLLDDFPNAAPSVQNVGLSLTDEKRFQGLSLDHVYIGLTGNLGALDGTHTTRLSTALRGRCKIYYTEDELPNWINRIQQKYRDDLGDASIVGFLQREPQYFFEMPNTRQQGGFASPRTWDHFVQEARRAIAKNGGRGRGEVRAIREIERLASAMLGLEVGLKVHSYYNSLMLGADPIARRTVIDGHFDEAAFKDKFKDGYSADSQFFAYQFAVALADYAVQELVSSKNYKLDLASNPKLRQVVERFGKGALAVNDDTFAFAIDHFKAKLANQVDDWSHKVDNRRSLTTDVKKLFARIISESKDFTSEKRTVMIDALSDADKFNQSSRRRPRG
jgi:DNA polymerase III delta prime subunit